MKKIYVILLTLICLMGFGLSFNKVEAVESKSGSYVFKDNGYTNAEEISSIVIDGFTFSFDKGTSSNTPKYYDTGTGLRLYSDNIATVGTSASKVITKIVLNCSSTNYVPSSGTSLTNCTFSLSGSTATYTIVDDSKAFSFGVNRTVRIQSIDVYTDTKAQVAVQDAFASVKTEANLSFGYTETISGEETELTLNSGVWSNNTDNNKHGSSYSYPGGDKEIYESTLISKIFGDDATYVKSITRFTNDAGTFPGINSNNLVFYSNKNSSNNSQMDFVFTQNVSAIKVKYTNINNNKITLINDDNSVVLDGEIKVAVNSSSFTLKNCNPGDSNDSSSNRVTIDSLTLYFSEYTSTYSNFNNVQMHFQYTFDPSNYTGTVSETGFIVSNNSEFEFTNKAFSSTDINEWMEAYSKTIKVSKNNSGDSFTIGVDIPLTTEALSSTFYVCAYIVVDGVYYFATPVNGGNGYSVKTIIDNYLTDSTLTDYHAALEALKNN